MKSVKLSEEGAEKDEGFGETFALAYIGIS